MTANYTCGHCGAPLRAVPVDHPLPTDACDDQFFICESCDRVFLPDEIDRPPRRD